MGLVLDEFYEKIQTVGVSALAGKGFDDKLLEKFESSKKEYEEIWGEVNRGLQQK